MLCFSPREGSGLYRAYSFYILHFFYVSVPVRGAGCIVGADQSKSDDFSFSPREGSGLYPAVSVDTDAAIRFSPREGSGLYRGE